MALLGECELAAMQDALESTMDGSGTIYRQTRTSDSAGGHTGAFAAVGTAAFDVMTGSPIERETGGQVVSIQGFKASMPVGTDIQARDRIVCNGQTYEVVGHDAGAVNAGLISLKLVIAGR